MKKIILAVAVMGMAALGASTAHAGVRFSFGFRAPVVTVRAPVVVTAPVPVYVAPAPVVCAPPAPVVCEPPVVYSAPRVYCPPAPVVRFGVDVRHYHPIYHHGRW